ncbi:AraC family transcriptional regulator [Aliidongia dinghuensis]|uniref:AraC family transcriptional regulator n=1 Tax=Aliidongia dinghuensis TaxID=1867774 RepID=A0A8J3E437_9PROT|nr:AraC family transcriptional regulator [Aliidongia dinghuensis]GGF11311.1 AraC family transcriptional regulator [Aliidongia dinghuensis]
MASLMQRPATLRASPSGAIILSSEGHGWAGLHCELRRVEPGLTRVPGSAWHRLGIHFGPAVNADCRCDGQRHRRVQAHGDIDLVPAGLDGEWADDRPCTIFRISLSPMLLARAADESSLNSGRAILAPRFQMRDERIEHIAWALKAELEAPAPSGRLYAESLGIALAARLAEGAGVRPLVSSGELTPRQRRILVEFIENNLDRELGLAELAAVAGLSLTQLKLLFRQTMGQPVHGYVIARRVERARALLAGGQMAIAQAALAAGFAHQSHLAHWMRRLLGVSPRELIRQSR